MKDFMSAKHGQRELIAKEYQQYVPDIQELTKPVTTMAGLKGPMRHSWRHTQMQVRT